MFVARYSQSKGMMKGNKLENQLSFCLSFVVANEEQRKVHRVHLYQLTWHGLMFATDFDKMHNIQSHFISYTYFTEAKLELKSNIDRFVNWFSLYWAWKKNAKCEAHSATLFFYVFLIISLKICIVHVESNSFQVSHCFRRTLYMRA